MGQHGQHLLGKLGRHAARRLGSSRVHLAPRVTRQQGWKRCMFLHLFRGFEDVGARVRRRAPRVARKMRSEALPHVLNKSCSQQKLCLASWALSTLSMRDADDDEE